MSNKTKDRIAQLVERLTVNQEVVGSIPTTVVQVKFLTKSNEVKCSDPLLS